MTPEAIIRGVKASLTTKEVMEELSQYGMPVTQVHQVTKKGIAIPFVIGRTLQERRKYVHIFTNVTYIDYLKLTVSSSENTLHNAKNVWLSTIHTTTKRWTGTARNACKIIH